MSPLPLTMYAALCPKFCVLRKMRPWVVSVSFPLLLIHGTWKPGSVTNEWVLRELAECRAGDWDALPAAPPDSAELVTLTGLATENEKLICLVPGAPEAV